MTGTVQLEQSGPIATITFDNPDRRNAMTVAMWESIPSICDRVASDSAIRAVVLRGAGRQAFVAGADISEFDTLRTAETAPAYDARTAVAQQSIRTLPVPVLAAIQGSCIGGGLALALSADVRFCDQSSLFGLPPARLGIGYSSAGVQALVDVIGPGLAAELIFAAEWVDADRARQWRLVNRVIPDTDFDREVDQWLKTVVSRAPLSQQAAKMAIRACSGSDAERTAARAAAEELINSCFTSQDYAEGVAAFAAKRKPEFEGR